MLYLGMLQPYSRYVGKPCQGNTLVYYKDMYIISVKVSIAFVSKVNVIKIIGK